MGSEMCIRDRLYTGLKLDYRLMVWATTPASRAISAAAKLLVFNPVGPVFYVMHPSSSVCTLLLVGLPDVHVLYLLFTDN